MQGKVFPEILTLTKEEAAAYPLASFDKKIVLIDNNKQVKDAVDELFSGKILGFDTETKPSFSKGSKHTVSLLQLGTEDKVFLFRLKMLTNFKPFVQLLSDKSVIKTGVAIHDDVKSLQRKFNFAPGGFVEIQDIVKQFGITSFGLRSLPPLLLGFRISKNQQLSNWEASVLSEAQMQYAATDAWVSLLVYKKLMSYGPSLLVKQ